MVEGEALPENALRTLSPGIPAASLAVGDGLSVFGVDRESLKLCSKESVVTTLRSVDDVGRRYLRAIYGRRWDTRYRYHCVALPWLESWRRAFAMAARDLSGPRGDFLRLQAGTVYSAAWVRLVHAGACRYCRSPCFTLHSGKEDPPLLLHPL